MTAAAAASPALASLALALTPAASQATASGVATPPAGSTPAAGSSAFTALLLGMRPPPASVPAPSASPTADGAAPLTLASVSAAALPGFAPTGPPPLAAGEPAGKTAGESLPDGGSDVPLPQLDALLASLERAAAPGATVTPVTMPADLLSGGADAIVAGKATAGAAADPAAITPAAMGTNRSSEGVPVAPQPQQYAGQDAGAAIAAPDDAATTAPASDTVITTDNTTPESIADSDGQRGMDLALPAEFRARLDAALALASRPANFPDTNSASGPVFASSPLTHLADRLPTAASSALPDSLPTLTPLADRNAWSQGLGERLMLMADKGLQAATLRMHPEHLGPVEVKIKVDENGSAQVLFSTHHALTRDALETAMPRLREMFADQGLNLTQANVDTGSSAFAQRGFAAGLSAWNRWSGDEADAGTAEAAAWRMARPSDRRVDVLV